jgi:nicotinamidase-related amidase
MTAPDRTALLLIECQRGVIGDLSFLPALADAARSAIPNLARLAAGARAAGVHVVHLTYLPAAGGRATNRRARLMRGGGPTWTASDPASAVVPEIGVAPDDMVLPRHQGISPVHRTETLAVMRNLGVEEIVVAGVSTNLAIPLVAVAATDEDFAVTIPTDATAGTPAAHHASMLRHSLAFVARLTTADELLSEWLPERGTRAR